MVELQPSKLVVRVRFPSPAPIFQGDVVWMIKAVYMIFLRDDNHILMHKRTRGYGKDCYSPPGGHVEKDENAVDCVIRETAEELGEDVTVDPHSISLYHTQLRLSSDSDSLRIMYYYVIRKWDGEPVIAEPDKAEDLRWFDLSGLPYDHMTQDVVTALKAHNAGQNYSIDGFSPGDHRGVEWLSRH